MGPSGVVEADPFTDDTHGVLPGFEAMTMHALLFQRSDHAFDHAVLLRAQCGVMNSWQRTWLRTIRV